MKSYFCFLKRNPYYTIINVLGLSVALMFVITIGDYTWRQLSVDSWHRHADQIHLLGNNEQFLTWPNEARQAGEMLPDVECTCSVINASGRIYTDGHSETASRESSFLIVDSTFFSMFDYTFLEGSPLDALSSPDKCVITQSMANTYFPNTDPLGRSLRLSGNRDMVVNDGSTDPYDTTLVYTVSAVIKDLDRTVLPSSTQVIANIGRAAQILGYRVTGMLFFPLSQSGIFKTFYQLREGADIDKNATEIEDYLKEHARSFMYVNKDGNQMTLTPLRKVMFAPQNVGVGLEKGDHRLLIILLSAIIAVLLFAVTNYINLTVANTGMRAKEMATRRLLGSSQSSISLKLMLESILMVLVAFLLGLLLAFLFEDKLAELFRGKILIKNDISVWSISVCAAFILLTGLLSGWIPSMQLASIKPIEVVKGTFRYRSKTFFSRLFIMVQNLATVVMLTLSLVVTLQIDGMVKAPLGVNSQNLVLVTISNDQHAQAEEVLRRLPCVTRIGIGKETCPTGQLTQMQLTKDRDGNNYMYYTSKMDKEAFSILGLELLHEQPYGENPTYFTQKLLRDMDLNDNASEFITGNGPGETISGVIKDFRMGSILEEFTPAKITIIDPSELELYHPFLIVQTDGSKGAFMTIKEALQKLGSEEIGVVDIQEFVESHFADQRNTLHIIYMFTGIALLLSIFGFIGMSLFFIRQRRNEIATRRVFGGSIEEVIMLMLTKFCAPLLISCALAVPLAYTISERWLEDFSWKISLSPWIFIAACVASLLIALVSVLWQTIHAVRQNPADSIKTL